MPPKSSFSVVVDDKALLDQFAPIQQFLIAAYESIRTGTQAISTREARTIYQLVYQLVSSPRGNSVRVKLIEQHKLLVETQLTTNVMKPLENLAEKDSSEILNLMTATYAQFKEWQKVTKTIFAVLDRFPSGKATRMVEAECFLRHVTRPI